LPEISATIPTTADTRKAILSSAAMIELNIFK